MLQSFVPLFIMTFFICLFIVLMQFLWQYIDDLVGKGLGIDVVAELFFYAALTFIPMALPLAILLASLMTFGNLGERFELTAMKAAGISLVTVMKPLIWLMVFVAIGAFFFQNNVLPIAQTKMWTLLYSVRQKSPEVEIPEGVFYDQIPGYNLFVQKKNPDTGMLYDLMIYNMSGGFENASTILADSGRLAFTDDKTHIYLHLWQGESFENLREATTNGGNVPYRRESFSEKELLMPFDANFNRLDEQGMRSQYVGKNMSELNATIDSVTQIIDSVAAVNARYVTNYPYFGMVPTNVNSIDEGELGNSRYVKVDMEKPLNIDSLFRGKNSSYATSYINNALAKASRQRQELEFKSFTLVEEQKDMRRHAIELHKKFTLSFACIIFFFIGAPLGAIIKKGGLGTPLVISVFLFIVYWIIDNSSYKMARDGRLPVWEGLWMSSAILLPLGIFFTYKAVNDSAVFNADAYKNFFRKLIGHHQVRKLELKEVVINEVNPEEALTMVATLEGLCRHFVDKESKQRQHYLKYFTTGYPLAPMNEIARETEAVADYLSNSRDKMVVMKLMDLPILRNLWVYHPAKYAWIGWSLAVLLPIGVPLWLIGTNAQKSLLAEYRTIISACGELRKLINNEINNNS